MFSRRDMLAATAVGGAMTAASMTPAEAAPMKSDPARLGADHINSNLVAL
jgi:hypothetical protein